jgi:hypothetical protein
MQQFVKFQLFWCKQCKFVQKMRLQHKVLSSSSKLVLKDPICRFSLVRNFSNEKKLEKITILGIESSCDDTGSICYFFELL